MKQMESLRYEIHTPEQARNGSTVYVLLHGRGSDRRDLMTLSTALPSDTVLVTPEAPHPGRPWGYGPGWAWYRYQGGNRVDEESMDASLAALDRFLGGLADILPVRPGPVVLGGFSQGGTTSIAFALENPGRVAGVANFSGFLADGALEKAPVGSSERLSLFWGHGTGDPNIPLRMAQEGRRALGAAGVRLTTRDYPIGHWIAPEELADTVAWVEGLLAG